MKLFNNLEELWNFYSKCYYCGHKTPNSIKIYNPLVPKSLITIYDFKKIKNELFITLLIEKDTNSSCMVRFVNYTISLHINCETNTFNIDSDKYLKDLHNYSFFITNSCNKCYSIVDSDNIKIDTNKYRLYHFETDLISTFYNNYCIDYSFKDNILYIALDDKDIAQFMLPDLDHLNLKKTIEKLIKLIPFT